MTSGNTFLEICVNHKNIIPVDRWVNQDVNKRPTLLIVWSWSSSNILQIRKESKRKVLRNVKKNAHFNIWCRPLRNVPCNRCSDWEVFQSRWSPCPVFYLYQVLCIKHGLGPCNLYPCVTQVDKNVLSLRWLFVHNTDEYCGLRKIAWWKLWVACKFNENNLDLENKVLLFI